MTETETATSPKPDRPRTRVVHHGAGSAVYGLGFIGALVYFIQHATTFGLGVLGVLKAMVWPAFVVYRVLEILKM